MEHVKRGKEPGCPSRVSYGLLWGLSGNTGKLWFPDERHNRNIFVTSPVYKMSGPQGSNPVGPISTGMEIDANDSFSVHPAMSTMTAVTCLSVWLSPTDGLGFKLWNPNWTKLRLLSHQPKSWFKKESGF